MLAHRRADTPGRAAYRSRPGTEASAPEPATAVCFCFSSCGARSPAGPEELLTVPQRVVVQDGGPEIAQPLLGPDQNIGAYETHKGEVLRHQLLDPIIETFPLRVVELRQLLPHQ